MRLTAKVLIPAGIVLAAIVYAIIPMPGSPSEITWERDYEKAVQRAAAENKSIIADMFTDWCVLCKKMDAETFADSGVIKKMASEYVWLKLNTETEEDGIRLAKELGIFTYPTILMLDSEGEEVDRISQFLPAAEFEKTVVAAVNNPNSLASLRKAVNEHPDSVTARWALADKLLTSNSYAKAGPHFQKIVELDPENHEGKTDLNQYNFALCLASEMKFDEALAQLDSLKKKFPRSGTVADATVLRAEIYHCCNRLNEAQAALQEYKDKYPTQGHIEEVENLLAAMEAQSGNK